MLSAALLLIAVGCCPCDSPGRAVRPIAVPGVYLRVNQAGYLPDDPKVAVLSSDHPVGGRFSVGSYSADVGPDQGAWGPFAHNYRLDFTPLRAPGRYRVFAGGAESVDFRIAQDVRDAVAPRLVSFMRFQRCGDVNPVTGEICHMQDGIDVVSGKHVDLTGGWHDAADRLKHMITTSYCVAALYLAGAKEEADWGAKLLRKIHPDAETIYVQIGDDRDHTPPLTLWHDDQSDYGYGKGGPRAAWPAEGRPQGPKYRNASTGKASLAARTAAALALAGDVEGARSCYELARRSPGAAMSVPVKAPHYYGESTFYDDLEWGAVELYRATKERRFLDEAIGWADKAGDNPWMGKGRHGHYEFFPYVNLAHWRLYALVDDATKRRLAGYYRAGLEACRKLAEANPYRLGTPLVWCSTNDVVAVATQAVLYERMTGDAQFRPLAAACRDWIFGRNPWGVSFVIGTPGAPARSASRPHHAFYKLKGYAPAGGLVDGPVYKDINESLKFAPFPPEDLGRFNSDVGVYHDAFEDFSTNEPIIDGTVSLFFLLSQW